MNVTTTWSQTGLTLLVNVITTWSQTGLTLLIIDLGYVTDDELCVN
jgi:hypothetical protein